MTNYVIEDNIDFYSELTKILDQQENENEDKCCLITHQPLRDKYFMMKCGIGEDTASSLVEAVSLVRFQRQPLFHQHYS